MEPNPREETPEAMLDAYRAHPEWGDRERDAHLARLASRFPQERLLGAVRPRLCDLGAAEGPALLRLVEAFGTPDLLAELARALVAQPGLAPERSWEALGLLDSTGMLDDYPELAERWAELDESLDDEEESLAQLAAELEDDPDGSWLALQGLGAVEPEVRPQIIAGLSRAPLGPGLLEFLRILSFAHDPATRVAALDALSRLEHDDAGLVATWARIAAEHADPEVVARARRWLGAGGGQALARVRNGGALSRPGSTLVHSLVTALDGNGQGYVVLSSRRGATRATAAFLVDVCRGVVDVVGQLDPDGPDSADFLRELAGNDGRETVADAHALALRLLAGSLSLCTPATPPALRFWLEQAAPADLRPGPIGPPFPGWDPASIAFDEMPARARDVLDACPSWCDGSPLTYELAEEIALREGNALPDPKRDAGAYRYLFEHRLGTELEPYRRMLLWMANFWAAAGNVERGRSALALAWQLSDAQHAVPGHPFTVALSTRSLTAALEVLKRGVDPRRGGGR